MHIAGIDLEKGHLGKSIANHFLLHDKRSCLEAHPTFSTLSYLLKPSTYWHSNDIPDRN